MNVRTIFFLISCTAIILVLTTACKEDHGFDEIIENIRQVHAPDARENIFDIKAERRGRMTVNISGEVDNEALKSAIMDSLYAAGFEISENIDVLPVDVPWPWALVNISVANIRATPSHRSELVTQAIMGNPVRVLKEQGSWVLVQTPDRYLGWCSKSSLEGMDGDELDKWKSSPRVIYSEIHGFINSLHGGPVSDITASAILVKEGSEGEFLIVSLPDGRNGTIERHMAYCLEEWSTEAMPSGDRITEAAMAMHGFPYLWGGTSPKGIDCSGYTRIVWFMNGMVIARDASLQARHGEPVYLADRQHFEAGDLLFFRTNPDDPDGSPVTHVGIYLGDSEYIHAAGMVTVNSLDSTSNNYSAYRASTLQSARRTPTCSSEPGLLPVKDHPWYF